MMNTVKGLPKISFCLMTEESKAIDEARRRLGQLGILVNRSELIRAAVRALAQASDTQLRKAAEKTPNLKPGRRSVSG